MRHTHPGYRADIDGLRAIAVMSVVGYHAFPTWFGGGFVGVDVFFVISGFLISTILFGSLRRDTFSLRAFYGRRIRRIFPALLIVGAASYVAGWFLLLPGEFKQLGSHLAAGAGFIVNLTLWKQADYFDNAADTKPLLHLWSLGVEEQFYIVWPVLLWLVWKRIDVFVVTLVIAVASFVLNVGSVANHATAAFYSPLTRFWELLVGAILAYRTLREPTAAAPPQKSSRNLRALLGLTLIGSGVLVIDRHRQFPGFWALLPTVGAALVIAAGAEARPNRTLLSSRVLVGIGLISYPLYLWHWSLLSFARIIESRTPSLGVRAALVVASIVLAWLTYVLVETRVRFGGHGTAKTATLVLLMVVLGGAGYHAYAHDGLPGRYPPIVQQLASFTHDYAKDYRYGTCFLRPDDDVDVFATCKPASNPTPRKSIVLWGDSYAAHLDPGYEAVFGGSYTILQRTASQCPPFMGVDIQDRAHCRNINDGVYRLIVDEKPERVVLAAFWTMYDWQRIADTVTKLRAAGIVDVDIVGPMPQWRDSLPQQLARYVNNDPLHRVPTRMTFGLDDEVNRQEAPFARLAKSLPARYLSPMDILCNEGGCLTRLGDGSDSLTAWDYGHLTRAGSVFVVSHFPRD